MILRKIEMINKKKRKIVGFVLFVILNAAVITITAVSEFSNSANASELSEVKINWWLLIPAIVCFVLATLANIYKYVIMIKESYDKDQRPTNRFIWEIAWRVVMLGKYYDNITPAAIGGQPFQIYYMHKNSKLSSGHATSIPIVGMIVGQVGFLILAIFCFLFSNIAFTNPALMVTAWFGLLFYAFWPVMVAGVSFFPKATAKFLQFCVKVLAKVKIVKNRKEALEKVEKNVAEYAKSIRTIAKTKGLLVRTIVLATIFNILMAMIPFFVLTAFGGKIGFFECFALTVAVMSAIYFIPTPGNAGAAEGTFFLVFSALASGYVFWAMLVWRFFSYYIYIIIGLIIYLRMHFEKKSAKAGGGNK